jgi:hypothetical protein
MRLQKLSRIILSPAQTPKNKKSRIALPSLVHQQKWYIETITFIGHYLNSCTLAAINYL